MSMRGISRLLPFILMAGAMTGMTPLPDNDESEPKDEPDSSRQPEVDRLTKKQRKVYCRVLVETQDRDKALLAAKEV